MSEFQITTNFSYSLKVGLPNYSSKDGHGSISIGETVEAESFEQAVELGQTRAAIIANFVKTQVANEMGVTLVADGNGALQPSLGAVAQEQVQTNVVPFPQASGVPAVSAPTTPAPSAPGTPSEDFVRVEGRPAYIFDNRQKRQETGKNLPHFNVRWKDVGDDAPNDVKYKGFYLTDYKTGEPINQWILELFEQQEAMKKSR